MFPFHDPTTTLPAPDTDVSMPLSKKNRTVNNNPFMNIISLDYKMLIIQWKKCFHREVIVVKIVIVLTICVTNELKGTSVKMRSDNGRTKLIWQLIFFKSLKIWLWKKPVTVKNTATRRNIQIGLPNKKQLII